MEWDIDDAGHRATLSAARSWGVSPSVFMGRELPAAGAPTWLQSDREAAVALLQYEAGLCPGCRYPLAETSAPENEFRFKPELPIRCFRCTAADAAMKPYESGPAPSALFIPIRLEDRA
jgi:hypothetical protein